MCKGSNIFANPTCLLSHVRPPKSREFPSLKIDGSPWLEQLKNAQLVRLCPEPYAEGPFKCTEDTVLLKNTKSIKKRCWKQMGFAFCVDPNCGLSNRSGCKLFDLNAVKASHSQLWSVTAAAVFLFRVVGS